MACGLGTLVRTIAESPTWRTAESKPYGGFSHRNSPFRFARRSSPSGSPQAQEWLIVELLVRSARQAQQLAALQVNFVSSVSHKMKTPLKVIRTAAFNLRGKVAAKPDQVERYGKLIQEQSEKLGALVEQLLR